MKLSVSPILGLAVLARISFVSPAFAVTLFAVLPGFEAAAVPIAPGELVAPKFEIAGGTLNFTVQPSVAGRSYQLQYSDTLEGGTWLDLGGAVSGDGNNLVMTTPYTAGVPRLFFRLALDGAAVVVPEGFPEGFALIPVGSFQMGDSFAEGRAEERPVHTVNVSAFYMGKYEVTKALWDSVRTWGAANGYTDLPEGGGKGANHPVHSISWYAMVKWCNARSQRDGLTPCYTVSGAFYKTGSNNAVACNWTTSGYRLPTEAEWEKAARGGLSGKRYPWGDTISHGQANYHSYQEGDGAYGNLTGAVGYHPSYEEGDYPYSSPVGSFAPNGYGLYDMAGNMFEWVWDWYESGYYASLPTADPNGPSSGSNRSIRGGAWNPGLGHYGCRVAYRGHFNPGSSYVDRGFRIARSSVP